MNREIGRNIKRLRTACHMTQDDLANQLYVTRQNISSWENGKSAVSVEHLSALSKLFDVSIEELIYGPSPNRPYKKFQRKYFILIGICGILLLFMLLSRLVGLPYIRDIQSTSFLTVYSVLYTLTLRVLSSALSGIMLCALLSLWGDLRLRPSSMRIPLLCGILLYSTAILLTVLVIVLYRSPHAQIWSSPFFLFLYRLWLTSKIVQFALPLIGSVLTFLGCNK